MKHAAMGSIAYRLTGWLLALSVLPLIIVSWYGYQNAYRSIDAMQRSKLEDTARLNVDFVDQWFKECERDLLNWSEAPAALTFLERLEAGWKHSGRPLDAYIATPGYRGLAGERDGVYRRILENYGYLDNLLVIDTRGNILYSVAHTDDLGTNLLSGPYANTRFARAYRAVLRDRRLHFSDLEHYEPSGGAVAGFLTCPMYDRNGTLAGVMAVQLKMGTMFEQFAQSNTEADGIRHYLVGADGLLRTRIRSEEEVLERRISTQQFRRWYDEHGKPGEHRTPPDETAFVYDGPDGQQVIGQHHTIDILGVRWAHISEIDESRVLKPSRALAKNEIFLLVMSISGIVLASLLIARRMTRPIFKLTDASLAYINGERDIRIEIDSDDELAYLARVFNQMIDTQKTNEQELKRRAQEALNALEQLKEQKFALDSHAIVAITDLQGKIRFVNERFEQISGYSAAELLGENHRILNSGVHPRSFWQGMYRVIGNGGVWHAEVCNRAKDGRLYWVDTTIVPFMGADHTPESYVAIRTDITARKEAEAELNKALRIQKAIFDSAGVSIVMTDTEGVILSVNANATEMLGYTSAELVGIRPILLHKPDEIVRRAGMLSRELGETIEPGFDVFVAKSRHGLHNADEWSFIRKDGSVFPVYLTITPLYQVDGTLSGYIGIGSDISKVKEAEELIVAAKEAAEASTRAKSEFLAAMSHEIRTPMNGVIGMLGLLERSDLTAAQRHQLRIAQNSAHSLLGLINDILDFSKIEAGKMELDAVEFHLIDLLSEAVESVAFRAHEKGLELILDVERVPNVTVISDPGRLHQIIVNLLGNAIKFTAAGEIVVKAELAVGEGKLRVEVKDTGIGIEPGKIASLFESFTQADASTTRKYGGTGLGLAIVKRLCALMGGSIRAESVENGGSTFVVEVAVRVGSPVPLPISAAKGKRVLIVDANDSSRDTLRRILEQWGLIVSDAPDRQTALTLCRGGAVPPFDYGLIDLQMPHNDGGELARELRSLRECDGMKLIVMIPIDLGEDLASFTRIGFNGYLTKPVMVRDLARAIGQPLTSAAQREESASYGTLPFGPRGAAAALEAGGWPAGTRLLLVEDNPTNQIVAQGILEAIGLQADLALNGLEALAKLRSAPPDAPYTLVLMDCQMPEMDGYAATEAIREGEAGEANRDVTVVAMTANAMRGDRDRCILSGMNDYVAKPIHIGELKRILTKWLVTTDVPEGAEEEESERGEWPVWDEADALIRMGGNRTLLAKVVESFVSESPSMAERFEAAVSTGNWPEARLHAHSLKGSAGNVGAVALHRLARELEECAAAGEGDACAQKGRELRPRLEETLAVLRAFLSSVRDAGSRKNKRFDPIRLGVELQQLRNRLDAGERVDPDGVKVFGVYADAVFNARMEALENALREGRHTEALTMIAEVMEELE